MCNSKLMSNVDALDLCWAYANCTQAPWYKGEILRACEYVHIIHIIRQQTETSRRPQIHIRGKKSLRCTCCCCAPPTLGDRSVPNPMGRTKPAPERKLKPIIPRQPCKSSRVDPRWEWMRCHLRSRAARAASPSGNGTLCSNNSPFNFKAANRPAMYGAAGRSAASQNRAVYAPTHSSHPYLGPRTHSQRSPSFHWAWPCGELIRLGPYTQTDAPS